jgi:hypothetical protein
MRNLTATICLTLAVLLGSAGMSWSADSQKGLTAYDSGDYATALREWKPLAKQGYASAQNHPLPIPSIHIRKSLPDFRYEKPDRLQFHDVAR